MRPRHPRPSRDRTRRLTFVTCEACSAGVPAAAYCGNCGADLTHRGDGRGRLRARVYAAAPQEHLLRFKVAGTLFPQLSPQSRAPFRMGLLVLVTVLLGLALLGWQAPLVTTCAFGLPALYLLYLREAGLATRPRGLPLRTLMLAGGLGLTVGAGWGVISGAVMVGDYDVGLDTGVSTGNLLLDGLAIPVAGSLLMLLPVVLVRIMHPVRRKSLDGLVVGSLGTVSFTAATIFARLAPQLAAGPVSDRPASEFIVEAGLRGLVLPLIAAAAGGIVGIALWFVPDRSVARRRPVLWVVLAAYSFVVLVYSAMGMVEMVTVLDEMQLALHMVFPILMLSGLRIAIQAALLYEVRDPVRIDQPVLCGYCGHVIPDMPFCPSCGASTGAAPLRLQSGESLRRPGYALPPGSYSAVPVRHSTYRSVVGGMSIALGAVGACAFLLSTTISPTDFARYRCPPDCGRPPIGKPVAAHPRFTASDGEFSVSYPGESAAYEVDTDPNGVVLNYVNGDTGTMELFGLESLGRSPRELADELIKRNYPDAVVAYEIPNASVGYQRGYGVAADVVPQNPDGRYVRLRVLVLVAVKNDYALIASAVGPFRRFGPDFGNGHPSGANLELAMDMGQFVNSFRWRGDPPR